MILHRFAVLAAACLCAGRALAGAGACLTADSLTTGIRATYADGTWADYRAEGDGLVRITESPDPATRQFYSVLSRYGLYDLTAVETDGAAEIPATRIETVYPAAAGAPSAPDPGTVWSGRITRTMSDGAAGAVDAFYVFNDAAEIAFGACTYPTVTVKAAFMLPEGWLSQEFTYFPTLGFAAVVGSQIDSEPGPRRAELTKLAGAAP